MRSGKLWWVLQSPQTLGIVLSDTKFSIPLPKGKMLLPRRVTRVTNPPGGRLQCFPQPPGGGHMRAANWFHTSIC